MKMPEQAVQDHGIAKHVLLAGNCTRTLPLRLGNLPSVTMQRLSSLSSSMQSTIEL